ncbi:MAG: isoprenylcysteine carboxylmethyltransferase family protein [Candidatus Hydrogenedentes bacterium]|nr:isoprenylcysteine carboxylmethyltransferase family protein [Candidatus Hydrogenedentota bacterium]
MSRVMIFAYGVACYIAFLGSFLYAIGFVANVYVPKSIDSTPTDTFGKALMINVALLMVFALQHSIMARKGFKTMWTKVIPKAAERSTYVLFSSLALILLFWQWRPMGGIVWEVTDPVAKFMMHAVAVTGWLTVLATTYLINHFDLFGLRQVWLNLLGREYTPLRFTTPGPYRHVRHPLYVGWLMAFWATPTMTMAHLVFSLLTTAYILVAIRFEERDLEREHGRPYAEYRKRVPMLVPRFAANKDHGTPEPEVEGNIA